MQQLIPLIKDLAASFTRQQLRFAFGGALANNFWGIVRTTQDIDCLVAIPAMKYQLIADELSSIGCDMREDDGNLVPVTVPRMRDHADQRKLIECFRDSIRVELFVPVIPLQHELLRRGVWMPLDDQQIPITTAEDLVLLKLAFHREKDLQDVRGILWVQRGRLDLAYLRQWSTEMFADDVRSELEALIAQYANSD
jgi:hypothetical protein